VTRPPGSDAQPPSPSFALDGRTGSRFATTTSCAVSTSSSTTSSIGVGYFVLVLLLGSCSTFFSENDVHNAVL